jgi:tetratricopeptide (TPR) repeat protein
MLHWPKYEMQQIVSDNDESHEYFNKASMMMYSKKLDHALDEINKAIELKSDKYYYYALRGFLLCKSLKYEESIADFTIAISKENTDYFSFSNRGAVYMLLKNYQNALNDFEEAVRLQPHLVYTRLNRALVKILLKKYQDALVDLNIAYTLDTEDLTTLAIRGELYSKINEPELALKDLNKLIMIKPTCNALLTRGSVYLNIGERINACIDFSRIVQMDDECKHKIIAQKNIDRVKEEVKKTMETIFITSIENTNLSECLNKKGKKRKFDSTDNTSSSDEIHDRKILKSFGDEFICPITMNIMKDPVIAEDGHSYERCAIELWIVNGNKTSPMTNKVLKSPKLIPNYILKKCIQLYYDFQKE